MRIIPIALLAAALMMPGKAAAISTDTRPIFAQAAASQPMPKKKAKRKRAPKVEYMRAVPSR
jgi:hypothetical protein